MMIQKENLMKKNKGIDQYLDDEKHLAYVVRILLSPKLEEYLKRY